MLEQKNEKKKVSLEDLLRVKREEKPSDDFWLRFDRDLEKKIVRSVVHRESSIQAAFRWVYRHGKGLSAVSCLAVGAYLLLTEPGNTVAEQDLRAGVRPAQAASEALEKVDTWSSGSAPSLHETDQSYVIEVLSSGAGPSSGAGRTWLGAASREETGSYYVADQLSSSELGWSGERLPF